MQNDVQTYYTIGAGELLWNAGSPSWLGENQPCLNVLLDIKPSQLPGLFNLLNKRGSKFIFSIPAETIEDEPALRALLPGCYLLASMSLYAEPGKPFIPVLCKDNDKVVSGGLMQHYFAEQGNNELQVPVFNTSDWGIQETACCTFLVHGLASPADADETFHSLPAIIAFEPRPADLTAWFAFTRQLETFITVTQEAKAHYLQNQYREEMDRWEKRTLLYRQFLQLSKQVQEQEYYEVIDWYKHEYEILPLWYKRLGHIIKVLMGKRNFRSLFSDNVKKYKD